MVILLIKMLPLTLLSLAGYLLNRLRWIDSEFNHQLSRVMINYLYPCLIISVICRNFTWAELLANWKIPGINALLFIAGGVVGCIVLPLLKNFAPATKRTFLFSCQINNYSFLPILMATALWDERAVALIIFASLGIEVCAWTIGIKTITGTPFNISFLRNIFSLPMLSLLLSFVILLLRAVCEAQGLVPAPDHWFGELMQTLLETIRIAGSACIPASAIICGSRIAMLHPGKLFSPLILWSSFLRLIAIPAVCIACLYLMPLDSEIKRVLILVAIMPAAMSSVTFAEVYQGDADYAAGNVFVSHMVCLLTIPLWLWWFL